MHTFFGKWAPLEERGRLTSLTYGGKYRYFSIFFFSFFLHFSLVVTTVLLFFLGQALGTVLGLPITGFISASSMGWPGLFRFYALLSGSIGVVVWWLAADTPAKHPKISAAERKYIEDGLGLKPGYEKVIYLITFHVTKKIDPSKEL